jgi:hypothetical protein
MRIKIITRTLCSALQTQLVLLPDFLYSQSDFYRTSTGKYQKLVGDEVEPLMPEELAKAIRDVPRDAEVIDLLKNVSGAQRFHRGRLASFVP